MDEPSTPNPVRLGGTGSRPLVLSRRRALGWAALGGLAAPSLAACAPKVEPPDNPDQTVERRFRFGLPSPISTLDPALAADIDSQRVIRQCVETLIGTDAATGTPVPRLAQSYRLLDGGTGVEFRLRRGVVFHDGSPLTATSVRDTFERLYHLPRALVSRFPANSFRTLFGAHAGESTASFYVGCDILAEDVVVLKMTAPLAGVLPALSHIGFGILPSAQSARLRAQGSTAGLSPERFMPLGTGPFALTRATATSASLTRFDRNRTSPSPVTGVEFTVHAEEWSRLDALLRGGVDAIDLVTPRMAASLARNAKHLLTRDPFSLLYLGMNAAHPALRSRTVRQIISGLITPRQIMQGQFLAGTKAAAGFFPPRLGVRDPVHPEGSRPRSPGDAAEALRKAGYKGETVEFVYPTGASRIFLPYPERTYALIARQLQAAGINIKPVPIPWSAAYTQTMLARRTRGFHLTGLNGGALDPSAFVNALFADPRAEFGVEDASLSRDLHAAQSMPNDEERKAAYGRIGDALAALAPAVPLVVPVSALAAGAGIAGLPASPVLDEVYDAVRYS